MTGREVNPEYSLRAKKGWARRRLTDAIKRLRGYLGYTPEQITVYAEDFELLGGDDGRVDLIKGPPKPPCESQKLRVHGSN